MKAYVDRPTSRIAGIEVQITSRRVLPWIGGPSSSSSPGRMRNFHTENSTITVTITKIGMDAISRTSHKVSIDFAWPEAPTGNQSISSPAAMPRIEATMPMPSICFQSACACGRSGVGPDCTRDLSSSPMGAASYLSAPTNAEPPRRAADKSGGAIGRARVELARSSVQRPAGAPARAEVRRRDALIAPERLGELRGLAIADPVRDLAHG